MKCFLFSFYSRFSTIRMPVEINSSIIIRNPIVHIIIVRHRMAEKRNPTNVRLAQSLSPIHRTSLSIHAFIWALNHIAAKYVNANSPNCRTCNSTYARIRAINRINAAMLAVRRPSHNSPIYNHTHGAIKRTNRSSATLATNALPMS